MPDGAPFAGDPRTVLKRQIAAAADLGYTMMAGMEAEFFLFRPTDEGRPTTHTHDVGGYFDLAPVDLGEDARRAMVDLLRAHGLRDRGRAPRGRPRAARDRLPLRRRADDGRQPRDVPLRREARRAAVRARRVVHAEADLRAERQRDAHAPVALPRRAERLLRRRRGVAALAHRAALHRWAAEACARPVRGHQPARQLVQAARARLRGARQRRVEHAQPLADDPRARPPRHRHAHRAAPARSRREPVPRARR